MQTSKYQNFWRSSEEPRKRNNQRVELGEFWFQYFAVFWCILETACCLDVLSNEMLVHSTWLDVCWCPGISTYVKLRKEDTWYKSYSTQITYISYIYMIASYLIKLNISIWLNIYYITSLWFILTRHLTCCYKPSNLCCLWGGFTSADHPTSQVTLLLLSAKRPRQRVKQLHVTCVTSIHVTWWAVELMMHKPFLVI